MSLVVERRKVYEIIRVEKTSRTYRAVASSWAEADELFETTGGEEVDGTFECLEEYRPRRIGTVSQVKIGNSWYDEIDLEYASRWYLESDYNINRTLMRKLGLRRFSASNMTLLDQLNDVDGRVA